MEVEKSAERRASDFNDLQRAARDDKVVQSSMDSHMNRKFNKKKHSNIQILSTAMCGSPRNESKDIAE